MTTYADADLPMLFPGDQVDAAAARDRLAQVRATAPLAKGLFGPMVIHHRDVTSLLRDRRLRGPGMDLARLSGIPEGSRAWARQEEILLFMEGEDHHRLRRLVSKAFTPRAVEALRPFTRATIARLFDAVDAAGACDAVPALCDPFPIPVICALVGIEADRIDVIELECGVHSFGGAAGVVHQHVVAHSTQKPVGDARCAARAASNFGAALTRNLDPEH